MTPLELYLAVLRGDLPAAMLSGTDSARPLMDPVIGGAGASGASGGMGMPGSGGRGGGGGMPLPRKPVQTGVGGSAMPGSAGGGPDPVSAVLKNRRQQGAAAFLASGGNPLKLDYLERQQRRAGGGTGASQAEARAAVERWIHFGPKPSPQTFEEAGISEEEAAAKRSALAVLNRQR